MSTSSKKNISALEAQKQAMWIAYAPMIFQSAKSMINLGILDAIKDSGDTGMTIDEIATKVSLTRYGVRVLLHAGLGAEIVYIEDDKYHLTTTGFFLLSKQIAANVNINFVHDVCYQGMFHLEDSIVNGKPEGLKELGDWPTVYDGLPELPDHVKKSWLDLDHYFSDISYPKAFNVLSKNSFSSILDLGGNTGKFTRFLLDNTEDLIITIGDLPGQVKMAKAEFERMEYSTERVRFQPINILDDTQELTGEFDIVWMSQFLDCFHDDDIYRILMKCKKVVKSDGFIYIQDAFWDRQRFETSEFTLQQFSLYFTAIANGRSQMYDYKTFEEIIHKAGLEVVEITDHLGISNSLLKVKIKE
jgi:SAM-dependent methyltransferase